MSFHELGELVMSVYLGMEIVLEVIVNAAYVVHSAAFDISAFVAHEHLDLSVVIEFHFLSAARALHIVYLQRVYNQLG